MTTGEKAHSDSLRQKHLIRYANKTHDLLAGEKARTQSNQRTMLTEGYVNTRKGTFSLITHQVRDLLNQSERPFGKGSWEAST